MTRSLDILVIEDNDADYGLVVHELAKGGREGGRRKRIQSKAELAAALAEGPWDLALSDYRLPAMRFEDALADIHTANPEIPVILVTGTLGDERAVAMLKLGVADVVHKDNLSRLNAMVDRCLREAAERRAADAALKAARTFNEAIIASAHHGVVVYNPDLTFRLWNPYMERLTGWLSPEVVGRLPEEVFPILKESERHAQIRAAIDGAGPIVTEFECQLLRRGRRAWISTTTTALRDGMGEVIGAVSTVADITERKEAEHSLQLAAKVFTNTSESIIVTDSHGIIVEVNDSFTRVTGWRRDEVIGKTPRILRSNRHSANFYGGMWRELTQLGSWSGEIWNRRRNGESYPQILTISAVRDVEGNVQNYVGLANDITQIKEHERRLEHMAYHDVLTDLPNRLLLADRMRQGIAQANRTGNHLAVVYLDLDGFKEINDAHGHIIGDGFLVALTRKLRPVLRESDTLARVGGDEFVAVLTGIEQPRDCEPVLSRLLEAAAEPVEVDGLTLRVTASVGVAIHPTDGDEADLLLRRADQAMYLAKQFGKGRYQLFDADTDLATKERRRIIGEVSNALGKGEFVLHYQPKIDMRSGAVLGAEALIRWQHPQRGLLSPLNFLPAVDEDPVGIEIGHWVIGAALQQIAAWADLGVSVSVNVNAYHMLHADFTERLARLLAAHPEPVRRQLSIELVETSKLSDVDAIAAVMHRCRRLGVSFALDDFGTGYSSLTHLRRLPAETIKVDQTFVRDMLEDPGDLAIVEGIVALASAFRKEVVAEGVESAAQARRLVEIGCAIGQGYGIAKPMPAARFGPWAAARRDNADGWIAESSAHP